MPCVGDVDQSLFVKILANEFKIIKDLGVPPYIEYCKTSYGKEQAPLDPDWFFIRMASIARRLYFRSNRGVGVLRCLYGTSKRNGVRPNHHVRGSGAVIRKALQLLQKLDYVNIDEENGGRVLTSHGRKTMDAIAKKMIIDAKSAK